MKKSKLYGLVPVVLVAAAAASPAYSYDRCPFGGFYVGAQVGDSVSTGTVRTADSITFTPATGPFTFSSSGVHGIKKNSVSGALYAGYGDAWDCLYLGGEIFVKGSRHKTRASFTETLSGTSPQTGLPFAAVSTRDSYNPKLRGAEFGIDFRPGVLICPSSMLYGRVGVAFNRFHFARTGTFVANTTGFTNNGHKNVGALRLGAGIETELCECWGLRADYVYTRYRKRSVAGSFGPVAVTSPLFGAATVSGSAAASARLSNHTMSLGISYYW